MVSLKLGRCGGMNGSSYATCHVHGYDEMTCQFLILRSLRFSPRGSILEKLGPHGLGMFSFFVVNYKKWII